MGFTEPDRFDGDDDLAYAMSKREVILSSIPTNVSNKGDKPFLGFGKLGFGKFDKSRSYFFEQLNKRMDDRNIKNNVLMFLSFFMILNYRSML